MNVTLAYNARSAVRQTESGQALALAPNVAREPVAFDAELRDPVRFREAISALHDVVISDLRFVKRDKSAYRAWQERRRLAIAGARARAAADVQQRVSAAAKAPVPAGVEAAFDAARRRYWDARGKYDAAIRHADPELWRKLVPYDPVITVAPDACLFECFSGDESSYGCLSVDRESAFGPSDLLQYGTTNVDYSWDLYDHFQSLRSYRRTRFTLDPHAFAARTEVAGTGGATHREEKIDLPTSWLRGFMQIQVAAGLPATVVSLPREAVYSVLAWHKRRRARVSPRALRFELTPGRPVRLVLEPWEQPVDVFGAPVYTGRPVQPVRVWGVRRLLAVARLLPLVDRFDVHLLGTGLPHFWVARMGDMRLTLGLSGWTTNDWTRASALEMLLPAGVATPQLVGMVAEHLRQVRLATFEQVARAVDRAGPPLLAALARLANAGQVVYDLAAGAYRWRQILPKPLGEAEIGPEPEELQGLRKILASGPWPAGVTRQAADGIGVLIAGTVGGNDCEVLVDTEGRTKRGKCQCGWYRRFALKNGPCRHMMALRYTDPERLGGVLGPPPVPK
ncbi:MAG TPA: hypothetical protein VF796_09100 [Humisphaera sp.]